MKELEAGMWAYSKTCRDYGIGKIVNITENGQGFKGDLIDIQYKYSEHAIENQDVVASYNIIDLIEVGDYVNGYKVYEADKVCHRITLNGSDDGNEFRLTYLRPALGKNMGIKSIVTKEQFDSMKYVVGGKE